MRRLIRLLVIALFAVAMIVAPLGCASDTAQNTGDGDETTIPEQDGLEVGEQAPDFRLKNQDQETVALSDYLGVSNVILVFYPLAFTPV